MNVESITNSGIHYRSIYATTECLNRTAETKTARSVRRVSDFVLVGNPECAGINRHVAGNERVLQERRKRLHLGLESCGEHREVLVEA